MTAANQSSSRERDNAICAGIIAAVGYGNISQKLILVFGGTIRIFFFTRDQIKFFDKLFSVGFYDAAGQNSF
jgi:hypothetical protein